jgi:hypothetical protein
VERDALLEFGVRDAFEELDDVGGGILLVEYDYRVLIKVDVADRLVSFQKLVGL